MAERRVEFSAGLQDRIGALLAAYPQREAALLPLLHEVQREVGYFDAPAIAAVSRATGFPEENIAGVVSFYTMFHRQPRGRYHLMVCRTLSCELAGSRPLLALLREKYGLWHGQVTADGLFSLEEAECLAACTAGPALQVNGELHTRVTPQRLEELLESLKRKGRD